MIDGLPIRFIALGRWWLMTSEDSLLEEQKVVALHSGTHARLLAGPGTGKTLVLAYRAAYLLSEQKVPSQQIIALTFTRAAVFELRNRISKVLEGSQGDLPQVSTLHSFALRELLRNSDIIDTIPKPLRIADDWEERQIIFEDIKNILNYDIRTVREKFALLSADWQKLNADSADWEERFPDPHFLGAWRQHRHIFGYSLRSELVYQLKRALEQTPKFSLESDYLHLLVDEYQDLNRCDLAVIQAIKQKGVEIFGAGDDDQSIYGFRYAHPEGIRRFLLDYQPSTPLTLRTCIRCDRRIIRLALFIAKLDPARLEKPLDPRPDAGEGEIYLLNFDNQADEALGVAKICMYLISRRKYNPKEILILMRSDRNRAFSSILVGALKRQGIPVSVKVEGTPLDTREGRILLSILRLIADSNDSLALRTLILLRENNMGKESFSAIYNLAVSDGETFAKTIYKIMADPTLVPIFGKRIAKEIADIKNVLDIHRPKFDELKASPDLGSMIDAITYLADDIIHNQEIKLDIISYLLSIILETDSTDHIKLIRSISSSIEDEEQEIDAESVNIMTMHKAKGLTAKAVIIVAAEDEYIPGRHIGEMIGDERRLLYVSLSRACHFLTITYCNERTGVQRHTGRTSGKRRRTLTRFLRDAPVAPINGINFTQSLNVESR